MLHNAGRDYVSAAIGGTAVQPAAANFLGLTASTAAPVAGDTTLVGEIVTGILPAHRRPTPTPTARPPSAT